MSNVIDTRDKILEVALELFANNGFDGTSTREICKGADVNISMILYYFGSKEGLYKTIIQNWFDKQSEYLDAYFDMQKFQTLSRKEKAKAMLSFLSKTVDFLYGEMSDNLMLFLIREQKNIAVGVIPPVVLFLRKVLSSILDKDENSKDIVYAGLFIASQISSPRIMTVFKAPYGKESFTGEDFEIIKRNLNDYVTMIFKNAGVDL